MLPDCRVKCLFCGWGHTIQRLGADENSVMMNKWFFPFETNVSVLVEQNMFVKHPRYSTTEFNQSNIKTGLYKTINLVADCICSSPGIFSFCDSTEVYCNHIIQLAIFKWCTRLDHGFKNAAGDEAMTSLNDQLQLGSVVVVGVLFAPSLKLTATAPENWGLEDDPYLLGRLGPFSGANCWF